MWWPQTALQDSSAWLHQASDFTDALWRLQDPLRPLHGCLGRHRPCGFLAPPPPLRRGSRSVRSGPISSAQSVLMVQV